MTYPETLDWLFNQLPIYQRIGGAAYKPNLNNTHALCDLLNHPERELRCVHVAGTNGKGSTSHMLASVLQEAGYSVGLYTSPHLADFRERIRVNGQMIPQKDVVGFVQKYKESFSAIQLSFFEMTVGLAFDYFRKKKVDIAIIETGLGGRLDSTNVVTPLVSVITNIGYDHTQFLGDTLEKIAWEKAGIIKLGVPVVVGKTQPETSPVFRTRAKAYKCPIVFADIAYPDIEYRTDLVGHYQKENQRTAYVALLSLRNQGWVIEDSHIKQGIARVITNTGLKGRWQMLSTKPPTICDVGHNEDGIKAVLKQLGATPHEHLHFILGMVNDKEIDHVLKLLPATATYYLCSPDIPRGLDVEKLAQKAKKAGLDGVTFPSVKEALKAAQNAAGVNDLVFVGGSTFVVAEVV